MSKETHHIHCLFQVQMCFDVESNSAEDAQSNIGNKLREMNLAAHEQREKGDTVSFVVPDCAHINDVSITVSVEDDEAEEENSDPSNDKKTIH